MEYVVRAPHPALRQHVRRYTGYAEAGEPIRRREVVNAGVVLIVSIGPPLRLDGAAFGSFLVGMHAPVTITEHDGISRGVQVDLSPLGARMLLGAPMHEVAGRVLPLDDPVLEERLAEALTWEERFGCSTARSAAACSPRRLRRPTWSARGAGWRRPAGGSRSASSPPS